MEGKSVILSVLIMSMVMVQVRVEARVCCPSQSQRNAFNICRFQFPKSLCLPISGCIEVSGNACPSGYPNDILENSGNNVHEYCKLGCTSSVCAMTTLHNSGASEIVNGAFKQCAKACATFCNKGSVKPGAETA